MLKKEIKFIHDFSSNYIRELGLYFTVDELKTKELHPALIRYISAEVDYRIFQDRRNLLKNSAFDYSGEKINEYFNLIKKEIKRSKRFSANQIDELLYQAVEFNANFLMRPKRTLITFFFGSIDILTTVEIKQLLNYLYYYKFLVKIIKSYFKEKNLITISKSEFEKLLEKIDAIGIETHIDELLETAVNSMTDFFNIGMLPKEKIPLVAVDEYLAEKNLTAHRKKLRETFHGDIKQSVLSTDVLTALKSVVPEQVESIGIIDNFNDEELILEKVEENKENKAEPDNVHKTEETSSATGNLVEESPEIKNETVEQPTDILNESGTDTGEIRTEPVTEEFKDEIENDEILSGEPETLDTGFGPVESGSTTENEKLETHTGTEEQTYEPVERTSEQTTTEANESEIDETGQDILSIKEELEERKGELEEFIDETGSMESLNEYETSSVIDEIDSKIEELTDKAVEEKELVLPEKDLQNGLTGEAERTLTDMVDADLEETGRQKKNPQEEILNSAFTEESALPAEDTALVSKADEQKEEGTETQPETTVSEEEKLIFSEFEEYFSGKIEKIYSENINIEIKNYERELDYYVRPLDKENLERMLENSNEYDSDYMVEKINLAEFLSAGSEIPDIGEEKITIDDTVPEEAAIEDTDDEEFSATPETSFETVQQSPETVEEGMGVEQPEVNLQETEAAGDETAMSVHQPEIPGEEVISNKQAEIPEELLETGTLPGNGGVSEPVNGQESVSDEEILSIDEDSILRKADEIDLDEFEKNSDIFNTVMEYETEPAISLEDEFSRLELKPEINMSVDDEMIAGVVKEKQVKNAVKEFILMNNIESGEITMHADDFDATGANEAEEIKRPQLKQIDLDSDEKLEIEDIIHSEYMPRIIEVVFDYDMIGVEEIMGKLKECSSKEECDSIIDEYCTENNINPSIPEVKVFRSLIARTIAT